jgi:hypothetical protein
MTTAQWVQYTHLDKLYGHLPGMPGAVPAVLGMSAEQYAAAVDRFDRRARLAAEGLLEDPAVTEQLDTLLLRAGSTVLAVGDSITDDLQSWCAILGHALELRRRVAQHPGFRFGRSSWRNDDIAALAAEVRGFAEPVVDLTAVFGMPADPDLQGDDGVHPTLAGQATIARAVLATWAAALHPTSHRTGVRS